MPGSAAAQTFPEGRLSKAESSYLVVRSLTKWRALQLGEFLFWAGRGNERRPQEEGLALDAVEALIAAMFLDGGLETGAAVHRVASGRRIGGSLGRRTHRPRSRTIRAPYRKWLEALKPAYPGYAVIDEDGPEHSRPLPCRFAGQAMGQPGAGPVKKSASQRAAGVPAAVDRWGATGPKQIAWRNVRPTAKQDRPIRHPYWCWKRVLRIPQVVHNTGYRLFRWEEDGEYPLRRLPVRKSRLWFLATPLGASQSIARWRMLSAMAECATCRYWCWKRVLRIAGGP